MPARTLQQLQAGGESPATLKDALESLNKLKATSPGWEASIRAHREELLEEQRLLEGRLL